MDTPQKVIAAPQGVYLVTYRGTIVENEVVVIPRFTQRKGDREKNPLVYAVIQNMSGNPSDFPDAGIALADAAYAWTQYPKILTLDEANSIAGAIFWPNAWRLDTDQEIRLAASNLFGQTALAVQATALFVVSAYYKIPD